MSIYANGFEKLVLELTCVQTINSVCSHLHLNICPTAMNRPGLKSTQLLCFASTFNVYYTVH